MNWKPFVAPAVRYTVLWAIVTVGVAYFAFSSGMTLLVLAGAGVLLVVLGAGEAGAAPASGVGMAEASNVGGMTEGMDLLPGSGSDYSLRGKFVFYGLGLLGWSVAGLAILLR